MQQPLSHFNPTKSTTPTSQSIASTNTSRHQSALSQLFITCLAIVMCLGLFSSSAYAEDMDCKGLEQDICTEEALCRWVKSYERKDGKVVNGYCRKSYIPKKSQEESTQQSSSENSSASSS